MCKTDSKTDGKTDKANETDCLFPADNKMRFLEEISDSLINNIHNPIHIFEIDGEDALEDFKNWRADREADTTIINPDNPDSGPIIKYVPPRSHSYNHSSHGLPHCSFSPIERVKLILKHYGPVEYRGTIYPTNGHTPYARDSIKAKKEGKRQNSYLQESSMLNHVCNGANLGIFFNKRRCKVIAFDLDSCSDLKNNEERVFDEALRQSTAFMIATLYRLGLTPFLYLSGQKGYHFDVFFDEPVPVIKLNTLNNIILTKHMESGGAHVDGVYPSGKNYRVFGCFHWKTGNFTQAQEIEIELDDGLMNISWHSLDYDNSWKLFADIPVNKSEVVDTIIANYPDIQAPPKNSKRTQRRNANYAPKGPYYSRDIVKRIYETGLYDEYHRYLSAFQLGRYFRNSLGLTEDRVRVEIVIWLKRHFVEQCTEHNGLIPFEGALTNKIKSSYEGCEAETIQNCLNGFQKGFPFKREMVAIHIEEASKYLRELKYGRKQINALLSLLDRAIEYGSLNILISYNNLQKTFNVGSRTTVSRWLKEFREDNIFVPINEHVRKDRESMEYRLLLPEEYYQVLPDN